MSDPSDDHHLYFIGTALTNDTMTDDFEQWLKSVITNTTAESAGSATNALNIAAPNSDVFDNHTSNEASTAVSVLATDPQDSDSGCSIAPATGYASLRQLLTLPANTVCEIVISKAFSYLRSKRPRTSQLDRVSQLLSILHPQRDPSKWTQNLPRVRCGEEPGAFHARLFPTDLERLLRKLACQFELPDDASDIDKELSEFHTLCVQHVIWNPYVGDQVKGTQFNHDSLTGAEFLRRCDAELLSQFAILYQCELKDSTKYGTSRFGDLDDLAAQASCGEFTFKGNERLLKELYSDLNARLSFNEPSRASEGAQLPSATAIDKSGRQEMGTQSSWFGWWRGNADKNKH